MSSRPIAPVDPAPGEDAAVRPGPRERWQDRTKIPLALLAVAYLAAYATPILRPTSTAATVIACHAAQVSIYLVFVADYLTRLYLSRDRKGFVRHSGLDIVVLVLPALQPLRAMQLLTLLRLLDKRIGRTLRGRIIVYLGFATAVVMLVGALAVLDAERKAAGANIHTFGDAVWWATTTITTVGYGEHHPVTPQGRIVAACLMFSGIALLSVVTGAVASWMLDEMRQEDGEAAADLRMRSEVDALTREIRGLRADVAALPGDRTAQDANETGQGPSDRAD